MSGRFAYLEAIVVNEQLLKPKHARDRLPSPKEGSRWTGT